MGIQTSFLPLFKEMAIATLHKFGEIWNIISRHSTSFEIHMKQISWFVHIGTNIKGWDLQKMCNLYNECTSLVGASDNK